MEADAEIVVEPPFITECIRITKRSLFNSVSLKGVPFSAGIEDSVGHFNM